MAERMELEMSGQQFINWLAAMRAAGLARSDAAASRLLGVSANTVIDWQRRGTDKRTALACAALLNRLEPYA